MKQQNRQKKIDTVTDCACPPLAQQSDKIKAKTFCHAIIALPSIDENRLCVCGGFAISDKYDLSGNFDCTKASQ